jgi:hypothetical protein
MLCERCFAFHVSKNQSGEGFRDRPQFANVEDRQSHSLTPFHSDLPGLPREQRHTFRYRALTSASTAGMIVFQRTAQILQCPNFFRRCTPLPVPSFHTESGLRSQTPRVAEKQGAQTYTLSTTMTLVETQCTLDSTKSVTRCFSGHALGRRTRHAAILTMAGLVSPPFDVADLARP